MDLNRVNMFFKKQKENLLWNTWSRLIKSVKHRCMSNINANLSINIYDLATVYLTKQFHF